MKRYACPLCGFTIEVLEGASAVSHRCPKRARSPRWVLLEPVRDT